MNRKFAVVTTFNDDGYIKYGKRMIETFDKFWPEEVDLYVYYEGTKPDIIVSERIKFLDLLKSCPDLVKFKERWKDDPIANGQPIGISGGLTRPSTVSKGENQKGSFLWDAVRFSHKVYCVSHSTTTIDADVVIWLDADTKTFSEIPAEFISNFIPEIVYTCYLGRKNQYSECGFVSYNIRHIEHKNFIRYWVNLYNTGKLFSLSEWHDSYVFDYVRKTFEKERSIKNHNLTFGNHHGHTFINCDLGKYIDHMKGKRKKIGKSSKSDLYVKRSENYWNT